MKEKKEFIEIHFDSIKERIRYLDNKDPGKQDLDALITQIPHNLSKNRKKDIKMIEEKKEPTSLIETIKERIKYLEENDPNHVTLKLLKERISDNISGEDNI
jgi:DNA-binding ferritin-like protein